MRSDFCLDNDDDQTMNERPVAAAAFNERENVIMQTSQVQNGASEVRNRRLIPRFARHCGRDLANYPVLY